MTIEEARKYLDKLENDQQKFAVAVVAISGEDIYMYAPEDIVSQYSRMSETDRLGFCSRLIDDMRDTFEQHPDWGFGKLLKQVLEEQRDDYDNIA